MLCLQEAFTKTEGLLSSSSLDGTDGHKHVVFTSKEVKRCLRAPAIVVRERQVCAKLFFNRFGTEMGCCVVLKVAQNFRVTALATLQTPSRPFFFLNVLHEIRQFFCFEAKRFLSVLMPTSN